MFDKKQIHDAKNSIRSLTIFIELLEEEINFENPEEKEILDEACNAVESLTELLRKISDVVEFKRIK